MNKTVNFFVIVNCEGTILACYGRALGEEAKRKAREMCRTVGPVALRLIAARKMPRIGTTVGRSLSISFDEEEI